MYYHRKDLRQCKLINLHPMVKEKYQIREGEQVYFHGYSHDRDGDCAETSAIIELQDGRIIQLDPQKVQLVSE